MILQYFRFEKTEKIYERTKVTDNQTSNECPSFVFKTSGTLTKLNCVDINNFKTDVRNRQREVLTAVKIL